MSTSFAIRESETFRKQIRSIINFYNLQRQGLGDLFFDEVNNLVQILKIYPEMGVAGKHNRRKIFTRKFPFIIYYKIEKNEVLLLAIYHSVRLSNSFF
jgi:toxin ParE1/3/4